MEDFYARLTTRSLGRFLTSVEETESTNDLAREAGKSGASHGSLFVAERQSAGRGQFGRGFFSPPTGLYMSLLLRPRFNAALFPLLTLAAGVAAAEAVERLCRAAPGLKWPNDLYFRGRKLGGILIETVLRGGDAFAVCGVGINLAPPEGGFPPSLSGRAAALTELSSAPPDRFDLAAELCNALERRLDALEQGETSSLLEAYRARLFMLGRTVELCEKDEIIRGAAVGVDDNAALLVRTATGVRAFSSSGVGGLRILSE